jgi:hypothetical protein
MGVVKDACNQLPDLIMSVFEWINNTFFKQLEERLLTPVFDFMGFGFTFIIDELNGMTSRIIRGSNRVVTMVMDETDEAYATIKMIMNMIAKVNSGDLFYFMVMNIFPYIYKVWPFPITISQAITISIFLVIMWYAGLFYMNLKAFL